MALCNQWLDELGLAEVALWITTLWRMESNGVPRERMLAINFTDPLARNDDRVEQANRSSTEDQRRELGEAVKELKRRTAKTLELQSLNPNHVDRTLAAGDVEWIARIVWASQ